MINDAALRTYLLLGIRPMKKTRQTNKGQTERARAGAYFAILSKEKVFYGRILLPPALYTLVVIYDLSTEQLLPFEAFAERKKRPILYKHVLTRTAFSNRRWKLIGYERIPKTFEFPSFRHGDGLVNLKTVGKKQVRITRKEARRYEPVIMFGAETIEVRLLTRTYKNWPEIVAANKRAFDPRLLAIQKRVLAEMIQKSRKPRGRVPVPKTRSSPKLNVRIKE
jgi:hypothetical protein